MSVNAYDPATDSLILLAAGKKDSRSTLTVTTDIDRLIGETITVTDNKETLTADFDSLKTAVFKLSNIGTYTITCDIYSAIVSNETAGSNFTAEMGPVIVSWTNGTDQEISDLLDAAYAGDVDLQEDAGWAVGDERIIHLDAMTAPNPYSGTWAAQDIAVVIFDFDHDTLETPINGKTKACITVGTRECMNNCSEDHYSTVSGASVNLNGHIFAYGSNIYKTSFTKWSNLYMRTYLNSNVFNAISSSIFKNKIKQIKHNRLTTNGKNPMSGGGTGTADRSIEQVVDKIFLPSYTEIYGNVSYNWYLGGNLPEGEEGNQYEYYKTSSNRVKYGNNNGVSNNVAQCWWSGSPGSYWDSTTQYTWNKIYSNGSPTHYDTGGVSANGLSPTMCL